MMLVPVPPDLRTVPWLTSSSVLLHESMFTFDCKSNSAPGRLINSPMAPALHKPPSNTRLSVKSYHQSGFHTMGIFPRGE